MTPKPDHGEESYKGCGKLEGRAAIITAAIPASAAGAASFGQQSALSRAGQPKELAPVFVLLASDEASYMSGAGVPVTDGQAML